MRHYRKGPGAPVSVRPRVLVAEARFYNQISDLLLAGVQRALDPVALQVDIVTVHGCLELPSAIAIALEGGKAHLSPYDAVVALGCVIRGETGHYDVVAGECNRALMDLSVSRRLALGNGVLTVNTLDQALERADPARLDKGGGAVAAALAVLAVRQRFAALPEPVGDVSFGGVPTRS